MSKRTTVILSLAMLLCVVAGVFLVWASVAKRRAQSLGCVSGMVSICFAGRMWASDNGGHFPTNFITMSNDLVTPKVLICSADETRKKVGSFAEYTDANCSYVMVTPGVHESATNTVFIRCSIHGHLGYPDNTVFDGVRRRGKFD